MLRFVTVSLRFVYGLFADYYEHFTCSYDYLTNRYVYFTYSLRFGERYKTCKIEHFIFSCYQEVIEVTSLHIYSTISTSMAPKKKAVNVKSSALRKTPRKKRTRSADNVHHSVEADQAAPAEYRLHHGTQPTSIPPTCRCPAAARTVPVDRLSTGQPATRPAGSAATHRLLHPSLQWNPGNQHYSSLDWCFSDTEH